MSDGFSEGILYGGEPYGNLTVNTGGYEAIGINLVTPDLVFYRAPDAKEVLRITAAGELIIHDPTEAAEALMREWKRLRGEA